MKVIAMTVLVVCAPVALEAQSLRATIAGWSVEHTSDNRGVASQATATAPGGALDLGLGPVWIGASYLNWSLGGGVTVRSSGASLALQPAPWLRLGATAVARRFGGTSQPSVWRLIGATAHVEAGMGLPGLDGIADLTYFFSAKVVSGASMPFAFSGTVGARFIPGRSAVGVAVGYRFERFDLETTANAPQHREEFDGVMVGLSLRLKR